MKTDADERRDEAKRACTKSASCLSEILINKCFGWDEFSKEYLDTLKYIQRTLLEIRDDF